MLPFLQGCCVEQVEPTPELWTAVVFESNIRTSLSFQGPAAPIPPPHTREEQEKGTELWTLVVLCWAPPALGE